jgi:hypothetical protein
LEDLSETFSFSKYDWGCGKLKNAEEEMRVKSKLVAYAFRLLPDILCSPDDSEVLSTPHFQGIIVETGAGQVEHHNTLMAG